MVELVLVKFVNELSQVYIFNLIGFVVLEVEFFNELVGLFTSIFSVKEYSKHGKLTAIVIAVDDVHLQIVVLSIDGVL